MKFTEDKLETAIIELLGAREPKEVLLSKSFYTRHQPGRGRSNARRGYCH